jgi:hypothetical protein
MNPSDLYSNSLSVLTNARSVMLSPAWQASLDSATSAVRVAAGNQLIQLQGAILTLSNESLSDIATAIKANELALTQSTTALTNALSDITKVQNIMNAVASALAVVAKIAPLL